jgi:hypothetical protein
MFFLTCGRHIQKISNIEKNKRDHIQTHMENMFVIVELLHGTQRKRERKEKECQQYCKT